MECRRRRRRGHALEVLAGALAELSPEAIELLEVVPAAVAALRERVERAPAAAVPADRVEDPEVLSTALRQAFTAHSLTGHRVHQLGPALLTITLDAAHAQALAVLLAARRALPHQPPVIEDEPRWGAGPAALAVALAAYGSGTYARVLASGQVTAGLTPTAAAQVTSALNARLGFQRPQGLNPCLLPESGLLRLNLPTSGPRQNSDHGTHAQGG
ncbi:hypothetical protein ACWC98_32625 [Streptomyces goshikiensis]